MALPPFDFLTSAPIDQLGTGLGKDFDYLGAFRSGQGIRNDIDYSNQPMIQVMPPPFTIGDNPDVIKDMNLPDYMNFQKYMRERGAADLINPQNQVPIKDVGSDSTGIGEIILPPIAGGGGGGGGGGVEGAIDYNNLTLRNQSTGTGIDFIDRPLPQDLRTNTIESLKKQFNENKALQARFDTFDNYIKQSYPQGLEPQKTGILEGLKTKGNALLDFIKKGGVIGNIASEFLPEMDPRQKALRDFYGDNFDLTSSGSVASGIMKGYNPVSGGGLYTLTGGRLGEEPTYGLGEAIDERMDNIKDMLGSKYGYSYTNDSQMYKDMIAGKIGKYGIKGHTSAAENYFKLKSLRDKEKIALQAQEKIKANKEAEADKIYKEKLEADAITMAANTKNPDGSTAAYNYAGRDNKQGTHTSTISNKQAQTNRESRRGNYDSSDTKGANPTASKDTSKGGIGSASYGQSFHDYAKGGKVRKSYFDGGIVTL